MNKINENMFFISTLKLRKLIIIISKKEEKKNVSRTK